MAGYIKAEHLFLQGQSLFIGKLFNVGQPVLDELLPALRVHQRKHSHLAVLLLTLQNLAPGNALLQAGQVLGPVPPQPVKSTALDEAFHRFAVAEAAVHPGRKVAQ